jgi:hypothetical protein
MLPKKLAVEAAEPVAIRSARRHLVRQAADKLAAATHLAR